MQIRFSATLGTNSNFKTTTWNVNDALYVPRVDDIFQIKGIQWRTTEVTLWPTLEVAFVNITAPDGASDLVLDDLDDAVGNPRLHASEEVRVGIQQNFVTALPKK